MTNNDYLYHWLFHYNHYTELWSAFQRNDYVPYFNDPSNPDLIVIKSREITTLINLINKMEGDPSKIINL